MILVQEADTHYHEIAEVSLEQIYIYQCADPLILLHTNTSEHGVKTEEVVPGTPQQDPFGWKYLTVDVQEAAQNLESNTTAKRRGIAKQLLGQPRRVTERNDADIIAGDFNTSAFPRTWKGEPKVHRRSMGRDFADSSARLESHVWPDGGIRRLLRFHTETA